jgi:GntR family transcriptional regulator/MocR family aminotransferase
LIDATDDLAWLPFAPESGETLRFALRRTLLEAIRSGTLRPGVSLPASRVFARRLGLSRGVVSDVYEQLETEGYVISRSRLTPIVGSVTALPTLRPQRQGGRPAPTYDFTPTIPDASLFPMRRWVAAYQEAVRHAPARVLDYREHQGELSLRQALADRLGRTRGVIADPAKILVVQGTAQATDLLLRVLKDRAKVRIGVEDPSYTTQVERIRAHGLEVVAQAVDEQGLIVDGLECDAALLTPAHQFPTGVVLSGLRRRQIVEWAANAGAILVEDDYDGDFRYDREQVRALQGLAPDRVVYVGTVSKTLAPALRLGWIVAPDPLVDELRQWKRLADDFTPALDQLALEALLKSGEYDRHLKRARQVYRRRRDILVSALRRDLPRLRIQGIAAGIHLVVALPDHVDDSAIAAEAGLANMLVEPMSRFQIHTRQSGLVLGYGRLHESTITAAANALSRIVLRHLR